MCIALALLHCRGDFVGSVVAECQTYNKQVVGLTFGHIAIEWLLF